MNIFEFATRNALRFPSPKGELSVEQVWALPLTSANGASLDGVAIEISNRLEAIPKKSFVNSSNRSKADVAMEVALEVVKHIIGVKEAENAAKQDEKARETKRTQLEELLAKKQGEKMEGMSIEEIQKQLAELKG